MKVCSVCGNEKNLSEFNFKDKVRGKRCPYCKDCQREMWKEWYSDESNKKAHIERIQANNKAKILDVRDKLYTFLNEHPCIDCGEADILVLEFDHVRGKKRFNIQTAAAQNGISWESILKEIEKCEVRCRNCHKRRHTLASHMKLGYSSIG